MKKSKLVPNETKLEALHIAQNILKHIGKEVNYRDRSAIHNFIYKLSSGETRNKITKEDCERVIRIAKKYV